MMLINGEVVDQLAATDRGLHYGDGLFETIAVTDGQPRLWSQHMARLSEGCRALGIPMVDCERLQHEATSLVKGAPRGVLKIIITRGSGGRGYRVPECIQPTRLLALHPWPDYPASHYEQGVTLRMCKTRLGINPALAGIKHLNRLEQVLARNEWGSREADEGVMLDPHGNVIEGTMSNLFIIEEERLITPNLTQCGINGIMRENVLHLAAQHQISTRIETLSVERLKMASACFVTNSIIGLWPVRQLDDITYQQNKIVQALIQTLREQHLITMAS